MSQQFGPFTIDPVSGVITPAYPISGSYPGYSASRWVWDGDSITAGFGGPQTMAAFLNGKMVIVGNRGVAGQTIADALVRLDGTLAYGANIWMMLGTNDVTRTLAAYTADLLTYIHRVKAANLRLIVSLIPPRDTTYTLNAVQINTVIRRVCQTEGIPLCDFWETMRANNGTWLSGYSSEGIHPIGPALPAAAASANTQLSSFLSTLPSLFPCLAQPDGGLRTNSLMLTDTNADSLADNINTAAGLVNTLVSEALPKLGKRQVFTATASAGGSPLIFGGATTPGDRVLAICRMAFDPQGTTNTKIEMKFSGDYGAKTHGFYFGGGSIPITSAIEGIVAVEMVAIAASTSFDINPSMAVASGGTVTGVLGFSQVQFYNLTTMGLT
jgi:lysophospholipase L1-like esterase